MFGNKKCGRIAAPTIEKDLFNEDRLNYLDIRSIKLLRDEQREVTRKTLYIYRLWRVSHHMICSDFERYYSSKRGDIYKNMLIAEYEFYRRLARDHTRVNKKYMMKIKGVL